MLVLRKILRHKRIAIIVAVAVLLILCIVYISYIFRPIIINKSINIVSDTGIKSAAVFDFTIKRASLLNKALKVNGTVIIDNRNYYTFDKFFPGYENNPTEGPLCFFSIDFHILILWTITTILR
jgi:predicted PurR-regulated permease PerM